MTTKYTNPKDAVGVNKTPLSTVSAPVMAEIGAAMLEGARKYGRHNWRAGGVRCSVCYDAAMRHLMAWWEGQDIDPESGLHHITKALAGLTVLRDAQKLGLVTDDRPPGHEDGWLEELNEAVQETVRLYPDTAEPMTANRDQED